MLTGYQCEVIAGLTEYGDILCSECADDEFTKPLMRYSLDEEQSYRGEGFCAETKHHEYEPECDCCPEVVCERCGGELVAAFVDTYYHDQEEEAGEDWPTVTDGFLGGDEGGR